MAEQDTATDTAGGPSCPGEDNQWNVEKNNTPLDDGSRGDNSRATPKNEEPINKNDARQENNEPEVSTVKTLDDTKNDNEIPVADDSDETVDENFHSKEDDVMNDERDNRALESEDDTGGPEMVDKDGHMTSSSIDMAQDPDADDVKEETDDGRDKTLETIGPTTQGTTKHSVQEFNGIYGDSDSAKMRTVPPTEGPSCPGEDNQWNVKKNNTPLDDGSRGDNSRATPKNEEPTDKNDDGRDSEKKNEAEQDNRTLQQTLLPEEISKENELAEQRKQTLETIGPTTQGTTKHSVQEFNGIYGGNRIYWIAFFLVGLLALLVLHLEPESPPQKDLQRIDIFLRQIEKVKSQFANQRPELWKRSRIHLERHLNTTQPTEPVSLILTAGLRAERTLHCLAQGLASTFSSALNASVLHIDGASKASEDSDQVKLDIDSQLQGAFEGDKPVAVIHRFEELPPGSTLIFYRYCDHENAAYKKTFLIFTVLLGEEEEIPSMIPLSTVEEMVDDHLRKKFLSHDHPVTFDRMDLDKYSGLWSRISHLILPVAAETRMEHEGC
ncbi:hypothetical protein PAMA_001487 [Pampus argenteus]